MYQVPMQDPQIARRNANQSEMQIDQHVPVGNNLKHTSQHSILNMIERAQTEQF